jgi:hypothetical protein
MGPSGVRGRYRPASACFHGSDAPLRYVGVRLADSEAVDGPPSSAHDERDRGRRTIEPARSDPRLRRRVCPGFGCAGWRWRPSARCPAGGEPDPEPVPAAPPPTRVYSSRWIRVAKGRKMLPSSGHRKGLHAASIRSGLAIHKMSTARRGKTPATTPTDNPSHPPVLLQVRLWTSWDERASPPEDEPRPR